MHVSYHTVRYAQGACSTLDRKQVMVAAIVCGVLAGVIGFVPLFIGLRKTRKVPLTDNFGRMSILFVALLISFVVMLIAAVLCASLAYDVAMPFVLAEALSLSASAIIFGVKVTLGGKKEKE